MKKFKLYFVISVALSIASCGTVKEGFSNNKKNNSDEFLVEKKSPLVMPPEYNELPTPNESKVEKETNNIKTLISKSSNDDTKDNLDEKESNIRAHLNFGHTLGHAIESSLNYKGISHGEAVSIGMLFASAISVEKSGLKIDEFNLIENTLANFSLPARIPPSITCAKILQNMAYDKKNKQGKINFVLLTSIGSCSLNDHISDRYILGLLKTFQS